MAYRRLVLFLLVLGCTAAGLTAASCVITGHDSAGLQPGPSRDYEDEYTIYLTLYFRNEKLEPGSPAGTPVIPVIRPVPWTEAVARATVNALIRGPLPEEVSAHDAGPVIAGAAILEDIYIRNGICVVHISMDGTLALVEDRAAQQAEQFLYLSLVYSLTAFPDIDSVWLFQNGSPWQGDTIGWGSPLAPPGVSLPYKLYFRKKGIDEIGAPAWGNLAEPFLVKLDSPAGTTADNCPLKQIIALLARDYDGERLSVLPGDNRSLGFTLKDGLLTIDLAGTAPLNHEASRAVVKSLVYTFTELPEVDAVLATLNGETWSDGHFVWEDHLRRQDLDLLP